MDERMGEAGSWERLVFVGIVKGWGLLNLGAKL